MLLLTAPCYALLTSHQLVGHALGRGGQPSGLCWSWAWPTSPAPRAPWVASTPSLFFPVSAQCCSQPRGRLIGSHIPPRTVGSGGVSMRYVRDSVGSLPNATCDDHSDGSQEQVPGRQNQIYCTGRGDGDLDNVFEDPGEALPQSERSSPLRGLITSSRCDRPWRPTSLTCSAGEASPAARLPRRGCAHWWAPSHRGEICLCLFHLLS